jgi:hypothetical protein
MILLGFAGRAHLGSRRGAKQHARAVVGASRIAGVIFPVSCLWAACTLVTPSPAEVYFVN